MKKIGAIVLIMLTLSGTFKDVVSYISFKINQPYIAKVLCINKDIVELKCNGKCHLKTKIAENHEDKKDAPYSLTTELKQPIIWEYHAIKIHPKNGFKLINTYNLADHFTPNGDHTSRLFRPPKV